MSHAPKRVRLLTEEQLLRAESVATMAREAEATLILCAVNWPVVAQRITSELTDEDFGDERTRTAFLAVKACVDRGQRATRQAVRDRLEANGDIELVGYENLALMTDGIPEPNAAPWALEKVLQASERRQLLRAARAIASYAIDLDREHAVNDAFDALLTVNERRADETCRHVAEVFRSQALKIQAASEARKEGRSPVAQTGFHDLDSAVILGPGKLAVLAARPGMCKSTLAWHIGRNVARDRLVVFATLEMEGEELAARQIVSDLKIGFHDQATGRIHGDEEWKKLFALAGDYEDLHLYIEDAPAATIAGVEASARRASAKAKLPVGMVIIDYLGLVDAEGKDETSKTGKISRAAKQLAKALKCPVLLLSQLNRAVESRPDKRPVLSDLRQSGAIEQDANIVMFIYRDEYYNPATDKKGLAEIIIAKNREGKSGTTVELLWRPEEMKFYSITAAIPSAGYLGGGNDVA